MDPSVEQQPRSPLRPGKVLVWTAWLIYVGYLLLSDWPPGESLLHTTSATLQEAIALSLNFWLILPLISPDTAPQLHPALEGLFNLVVTWALLFWGFTVDGRGQRLPIIPFWIGTAFLTNVFYLLWLGVRQSPPPLPAPTPPLSRVEAIAESRLLPLTLGLVMALSGAWALWARPEFGSISDRWTALVALVQSDRLAYSFWVDLLVFWVFQGWLATDDMARRHWTDAIALWSVRLIPGLGLILYLWRRPPLSTSPPT